MAAPVAVNVGPRWALFEDQSVVEYIDLMGNPAGTTAGESVVLTPTFGRIQYIGARPYVGAWPSATATAGVTVAVTGAGTAASPWVVTLTSVGALAAGVVTGAPVRIVFTPGSN